MQSARLLRRLLLLLSTCAAIISGPLDRWHAVTNFNAVSINDIAYGAGAWVIVDSSKALITATNLAFPGAFLRQSTDAHAVEYGAGRFVVAGKSAILSSTNGTNWVAATNISGLASLLFANGRFVAAGGRLAAISSDGLDWRVTTLPFISSGDLAYGNGTFVIGGGETNLLSTDGMAWEAVPSGIGGGFYTIGFGAGKFVAVTTRNELIISSDARTWKRHGTLDVLRPGRIMWGNGYFVTVGGSARAYSRDAINWTVLPSGTTEYNVEFIRGRFIATGYQTIRESDPVIELVLRSPTDLRLTGAPGQAYRIEAAENLNGTWDTGTTVQIPADAHDLSYNPAGFSRERGFFRAVLVE